MTPLARSLALLRRQGWLGEKVEVWTPAYRRLANGNYEQAGYGHRRDWLGFADLLMFRPGNGEFLAVQVTTGAQVSTHLQKLASLYEVRAWLAHPSRRLELHGWKAPSPKGQRRTWELRNTNITLEILKEFAT